MVEQATKPLVTITGVSGYIGSHTCLQFLQDGGYRVRGTVRDSKNQAKIEPLRQAFGDLFDSLELVNADLLNAESIRNAVNGSDYVVHTASPFMLAFESVDDAVKPAVEGTAAILEACKANKVKRLVITSSVAAVYTVADEDIPEGDLYDESNWSDLNCAAGKTAYIKSKIMAERAAWDFQKSLGEGERFDVVTLCPSLVMGPTLISGDFASGQVIKAALAGVQLPLLKAHRTYVDVRDVALAHLKAVQLPAAANKRFILAAESHWYAGVGKILSDAYATKGYPNIKLEGENAGKPKYLSNAQAREVLGIEFRSAQTMLTEMVPTLVKAGIVPAPESK